MQALYMIGASLYPLGVGCKFAILGSQFMRFHLSDIGFPLMLGYSIFMHRQHSVDDDKTSEEFYSLEATLVVLRRRSTSLLIALGLSYAYETVVGLMYSSRDDMAVQMIGNFDLLDMVMYTVGTCLGLALLAFWRRKVLSAWIALEAAEAEHRRIAAPLGESRRVNRPRRRSSRRNRRKK
jgi:hypothetical protein